jgi:hypothetical protein
MNACAKRAEAHHATTKPLAINTKYRISDTEIVTFAVG